MDVLEVRRSLEKGRENPAGALLRFALFFFFHFTW
jgi:hypothetical protein